MKRAGSFSINFFLLSSSILLLPASSLTSWAARAPLPSSPSPAVSSTATSPAPPTTFDPPLRAPQVESLTLRATPQLQNGPFRESVVLVAKHGGQGSLGVVLNRPLNHALFRVFPSISGLNGSADRLYQGGPVSRDRLIFVFHSADAQSREALDLGQGIYMSFDRHLLQKQLRRTDRKIRVYAGYSGWAAGQLEEEIRRGDWAVLPVHTDHVFSPEPETLWERLRPSIDQDKTGIRPPPIFQKYALFFALNPSINGGTANYNYHGPNK